MNIMNISTDLFGIKGTNTRWQESTHAYWMWRQYYSLDSVDVSLVRIGDQLQGGVNGAQREHTAVQGLLWQGVIGGVVLAWHYIHWNRGLEGRWWKQSIK